MKTKTILKWMSNTITVLLFVSLILMIFVVLSSKVSGGEPQMFGYQLKTVLSGSMEPEIKTGSVIVVKPGGDMTRFIKGDIITFKIDEKNLVTHRIIDVSKNFDQVMYKTKGDSNNAADANAVLSQNIVAEYIGFNIPYLGYIIKYTNSKNGAFLLLVPGLLLLFYSIQLIWTSIRDLVRNKKDSQDAV